MKEYSKDVPVFSDTIQITEKTDRAHADNINAAPKQLLQNTLVNRSDIHSLKDVLGELNQAIADAEALRASLLQHGMVKLTESSAVTDSTGLALPATEKNAAIEGTLAHKISLLNTDYAAFARKMSQGIRFYNSNHLPRGYTIADDGLIIFHDIEVLKGDIVHVSGMSSKPYGAFSAALLKGYFGGLSLHPTASNSIQASDVVVGSTSSWEGILTLRITPVGTKPDTILSELHITVISCQMFYR